MCASAVLCPALCHRWGFRTIKMARDGLIASELERQGRVAPVVKGEGGSILPPPPIPAEDIRPAEMGVVAPCPHALTVGLLVGKLYTARGLSHNCLVYGAVVLGPCGAWHNMLLLGFLL
jgi:hypothetical protein